MIVHVRIDNILLKRGSLFTLLLPLVVILGLYSCKQERATTIFTTQISTENSIIENWTPTDHFSIELVNNSDESVSFWMYSQTQANYRNANTILNSIIEDKMLEKEKAIQIWKLCYTSSFHHPLPYNHYLPDNYKTKALTTFPYMLCGEKTAIVSNLAILAGLKTRVIGLNEHLVPEIYYNGSWHMFDADKGLVFLNKENEIASIQDLVDHPELVREENIIKSDDSVEFKLSEYQKMVKDLKIDYENIDTTFIIDNYDEENLNINLFPNDKLVLSFEKTSSANQWIYPRYLYQAEGYFEKTIQLSDFVDVSYQESIPFIIKRIEISGNNSEVILLINNRITDKLEETNLGVLKPKIILSQKFKGPSEPDLYYNYQLNFIPNDPDKNQEITVRTYFDFNALTSPFTQNNPVVFEWFQGNQISLSQKDF